MPNLSPYFEIILDGIILCAWIGSVIWVYLDAEIRGKDGWVVAFLVSLCVWPLSIVVWLAIRPPRKQPPESLRPQAQCSECFAPVAPGVSRCERCAAGK